MKPVRVRARLDWAWLTQVADDLRRSLGSLCERARDAEILAALSIEEGPCDDHSPMPFRDDELGPSLAIDPLARVRDLYAALDAGRGFLGDRAPLRLSAVTLLTTPGEAVELAARVRACAAELEPHYGGWTSSVSSSIRLVLAAALVRVGEPVDRFVAATTHVQELMRAAKVRRGGVPEVLAAMILRRVVQGDPRAEHVVRMREIYERMKHHHWFLTGPEDLAPCAMLIGRAGSPLEIGDHVEAIYQRLADAPKTWGGEALQTAASVLGLVALTPDEAAARFLAIATALRDRGVKVLGTEYDEVAVLAFLPRSATQIADRVAAMRERLAADLSWHEDASATNLAVNLAFVELLDSEPDARMGALADAKLLLDMQSIVAMRQAAAAAAAA